MSSALGVVVVECISRDKRIWCRKENCRSELKMRFGRKNLIYIESQRAEWWSFVNIRTFVHELDVIVHQLHLLD